MMDDLARRHRSPARRRPVAAVDPQRERRHRHRPGHPDHRTRTTRRPPTWSSDSATSTTSAGATYGIDVCGHRVHRRRHRRLPAAAATPCCRSASSWSGLSLVLLTMVFRSIWVPIKATLGYLLSVLRRLRRDGPGVRVGLVRRPSSTCTGPGPVISFLPILLMGMLFGLAMDYEVFLVSRMREEYVHGNVRRAEAVEDGFIALGQGGHRRRADHVRGVRRVRPRGRGDDQADRLRPGGRRRRRRLRGPDDPGARP